MKRRKMIEYLVPVGIFLIFLGVIIVFAGVFLQPAKADAKSHVAVGGFICQHTTNPSEIFDF